MSNSVTKSIFSQYFPKLEHMRFDPCLDDSNIRIDELKIFLEKHSKFKYFVTHRSFLWTNRDLLIETNTVQLNLLVIYVNKWRTLFGQFVDFLKTCAWILQNVAVIIFS